MRRISRILKFAIFALGVYRHFQLCSDAAVELAHAHAFRLAFNHVLASRGRVDIEQNSVRWFSRSARSTMALATTPVRAVKGYKAGLGRHELQDSSPDLQLPYPPAMKRIDVSLKL
jgi:hypothetical protein